MRRGCLMQNILINMCEKFHDDQLRNNRALGNGKPDNNKNNNNNYVRGHWRPVSGSNDNNRNTCWCSVVVSALDSINVVNQHWARLILGWVTACGQVNPVGM